MGFLVVVLVGAIAVAWIAILAEIAGTPEGSFRSGTKTSWLLIAIFFGILGAGVYLLAGRPLAGNRGQPQAANRGHYVYVDHTAKLYWCHHCGFTAETSDAAQNHHTQMVHPARAIPAAFHSAKASSDAFSYGPQVPPTSTVAKAQPVPGRSDADLASGAILSGSQLGAALPTTAATGSIADAPAQFKTCPDCAEQVRSAARKCRFCGYMFVERNAASSVT
jgi:predicted RNA-binding Zn-ribbon protein involved in translation (DUF1610 family)